MKVKMSDKYQVVIPREARKKMNIQRGDVYLFVKKVTGNEITYSVSPGDDIDAFAGILKSQDNPKPVENLRKMRDKDWN